MELNDNGVFNLCVGIVKQAVNDYETAYLGGGRWQITGLKM